MNGLPPGVPDLSRQGQVLVLEVRVLHVSAVQALAAQVPGFKGEVTLQVVDITEGTVYLVPVTTEGADKLAEQLQRAAEAAVINKRESEQH